MFVLLLIPFLRLREVLLELVDMVSVNDQVGLFQSDLVAIRIQVELDRSKFIDHVFFSKLDFLQKFLVRTLHDSFLTILIQLVLVLLVLDLAKLLFELVFGGFTLLLPIIVGIQHCSLLVLTV